MARELALALFAELPAIRKREVFSAVGHYVAGVIDREVMVVIIETLSRESDLAPGDKVRTLRGSLSGEVLTVLGDGRVQWRTAMGSVLVALPESLVRDEG